MCLVSSLSRFVHRDLGQKCKLCTIDSTLLKVTHNYNHIEYTTRYIHALKCLTYMLLLAGTVALMATIINMHRSRITLSMVMSLIIAA
jgi:hypothetical protein